MKRRGRENGSAAEAGSVRRPRREIAEKSTRRDENGYGSRAIEKERKHLHFR